MDHYRFIDYPENLPQELKDRYEELADKILATATEPIAIVWANPNEDWTDDNGVNPQRNCLLVTQHVQADDPDESTFGNNISTHCLY